MSNFNTPAKISVENLAEDLANGLEDLFDLPCDVWGWDHVFAKLVEKLREHKLEGIDYAKNTDYDYLSDISDPYIGASGLSCCKAHINYNC